MRRDASPLGWLLALALAMALLAGYRVWMLGHLGIDLFFDESQYWFWSTELAWGYYSKPPAIALLIGWSTALLGNDLLGVKAPAIVLNALSPLLAFAIGARLAGARLRRRLALWVALPDVGHMQKSRPLEPDVDEGRLHARQDAGHLAQIDVAHQTAFEGALDVQLLHRARFDDRHPRLLR